MECQRGLAIPPAPIFTINTYVK